MSEHQDLGQLIMAFFGNWHDKRASVDMNDNQRRFVAFANGDDSVLPDPGDDSAWDAETRTALVKLLKGMRAQWQVGEMYRQVMEQEVKQAAEEVQSLGNGHATSVMSPDSPEGTPQMLINAGRSAAFSEAAQMFVQCINYAYERVQKEQW